MSNPASALGGAIDTSGIAQIADLGPVGMITLRGDMTDKAITKAAVAASGATLPAKGRISTEGENALAWMSPDELLIICAYDEVHDRLADMQAKLSKSHALAVNVSDARALFKVSGPHLRDVIAKLAPVDMHPAQFTPGMFRRTRFAQVPAAFWLQDEGHARVVCFRSVAQYLFDVLNVASQEGSSVSHHST